MGSQKAPPEAEEERAGLLAHLVVRDNVRVLPAHIADVLQHRVALLPLAHHDRIRIDLQSTDTIYNTQVPSWSS